MSITAQVLVNTKYADASLTSVFIATSTTIIDKFTAANPTGSTQTLAINIVPFGGSNSGANVIVAAKSLATLANADVTEMQNQILEPGDSVWVNGGAGSAIAIRMSGRVIT